MKRRHDNDFRDDAYEDEGSAIGLTRAFSPIEDDAFLGGPISTDPFDNDGPFRSDEEEPENAGWDLPDSTVPVPPSDVEPLTEEDYRRASKAAGKERKGAHAGHGRHARHAREAVGDDSGVNFADAGSSAQAESFGAPSVFDEERMPAKMPEYMRKSRRMRRILIVMIVIALLLVAAGGVAIWQLIGLSNDAATQLTQTTQTATEGMSEANEDDSQSTARQTTVPNLVSLLGLTVDESIAQLQHGAQVSSTREINEEGNPIKSETRIALTAEPADSRSGTPTVYLGLNEEGRVIQAGYSAATSALGYGSLSFADAVRNESLIERTLNEAGLPISIGSVELPQDKTAYSTYASDGTTLTREYCSFSGDAGQNGATHAWSAALSYDYSMANATGNLADTIRTVYIYVNA